MTIYEPNPDVHPTGEEAGEFLDEPDDRHDDADDEPEPGRRRTGAPPAPSEEHPTSG